MPVHTGGGMTLLLTGLSGAGKTSIASAALVGLLAAGRRAEVLDGDEVRRNLWPELGLSRADRERNLTRIGVLARTIARNGVVVLVSAIAPYAAARRAFRDSHAVEGLPCYEIHVATPLAVCRERDVKGLYARHARGEITGLTGVDAPYEAPEDPDLRIETVHDPVERCAQLLVERVAHWTAASPPVPSGRTLNRPL
ncbi:adenylylsulfate kinase [Lentzea fradiae]|uniref:Adenylyl-sulfate kinase n=1 Tax=Lentzea fradiae TaxID=200378 RepID=A0A1G8BF89_9PSEU|nr:adenylyl-sulfate kinase [Lentzea fradiae]SDH31781.1 adenylylsulfate kinase [Lentzea fradiae]